MKLPARLPLQDLSRRAALTLFAVTLAALVVAAAWFIHARAALGRSFAELGERERQMAEATGRKQEAELRLQYAQSARQLLQAAAQRGLQPADWGERLINVRQGQFDRAEVAAMVAATARSQGALFSADSFELSVTRPDESLFVAPPAPVPGAAATPLSLTLGGSLLFRTGSPAAAVAADAAAPASQTP